LFYIPFQRLWTFQRSTTLAHELQLEEQQDKSKSMSATPFELQKGRTQ
jgi:DNA polymerase IIIc chi subunit